MGFLLNFFLNPAFLAGTVTAGVPVVIHLIHRRRAPRVLFSTLRFLRVSVERTARRRRIEDLLLLAMRSLLFFLLAFALAKPFLRGGGPFGKGADTAVAIVLDNSASMGILHRGERRFARAKETALSLISPRNLRSGRDACCVIFTNGPEAQADPVLQTDLQRVESAINESNLSVGFADLAATVQRAAEVLAESDKPNRELYVITDMQGASWKGMSRDSPLAARADIPLVVIDCGAGTFENLAITDLTLEGQGLVVEVPVTVRARIFNPSSRPVSRFVSLYINRARVDTTRLAVTVPPGGTAQVTFEHTFHAPGRYAGWVRIDNDSLELDNQRHFTLSVAERLPVLMVKDEENPVPYLDEAFFLHAALNPFSLIDASARWAIQPVSESPENLSPEVLRDFPVVFLLNCGKVDERLAGLLADFVRAGGGLIIGMGSAVRPERYNQVFGPQREAGNTTDGLLPARLEAAVGSPEDETSPPHHPEKADLTHFALKPFAKYPSLYQEILVRRYFRLVRPLPPAAEVLLALDGGDPLVVERRLGEGRVVLVTTTLNDAWTNMPTGKFYVIFFQRLVFHLARRTGPRAGSVTAGTPVRIPLPGAAEPAVIDVTTPEEETIRVRTAPEEGRQVAIFGETFQPGIYTYEAPDHREVRGAFAVNPDPAEADLAPISWEELRRRIPLRKAYYAADLDELRQRIAALREGVQLWNLFLFVVLLLAVFECFVANRTPVHRPEAPPVHKP